MFFRVFTFACVAGLLACEPPVEEISVGQRSDPIRNGTREPQTLELSEGQKLSIGWLHSRGRAWQNFCTGTLVAPRVVVTARHCIEGQRQGTIAFGIGLMPSQPFAVFEVLSAHVHPQRDAAVLVLVDDAVARHEELEPIPFNRINLSQELVGQEVEAAGYGETYDRSRSGRYFAAVQLAQVTGNEVVVDGRGEQGICFGDSGGPVVMEVENGQPVVLGVESWGDPSCVGVDHLTRLDTLADWIDGVVADALRPQDPECEALPQEGLCEGTVLFRCINGRYMERDCETDGLQCRRPERETGFTCAERDVCAEVGALGVCDGDTVVRCRFGNLVTDDCGMRDLVCQTDASGAFCTEGDSLVDDAVLSDAGVESPDTGDLELLSDAGETTQADLGEVTQVGSQNDFDSGASRTGCSMQESTTSSVFFWMLIIPFIARLRRRD